MAEATAKSSWEQHAVHRETVGPTTTLLSPVFRIGPTAETPMPEFIGYGVRMKVTTALESQEGRPNNNVEDVFFGLARSWGAEKPEWVMKFASVSQPQSIEDVSISPPRLISRGHGIDWEELGLLRERLSRSHGVSLAPLLEKIDALFAAQPEVMADEGFATLLTQNSLTSQLRCVDTNEADMQTSTSEIIWTQFQLLADY